MKAPSAVAYPFSATVSGRRVLLLLLCLSLFAFVLRVSLTLNREIDIDEFQHLHAAWIVSHHYVVVLSG